MEHDMKHWYYSEWNDHEDATASGVSAGSGASPWGTQPAVDYQSPDTWTRGQATLTTFGDGGSTTPRRTATAKEKSQTTVTLGARCPSGSDQWTAVSTSASDAGHECYVVSLHDEQSGDVATANEQCRCPKRALLVITDDDDDAGFNVNSGVNVTTSKGGGIPDPADESRCPPAPRRSCIDCAKDSTSPLNRKPKMVVKPNCDQATATPAARRYYDTTSGRRLAKHHLPTEGCSLERGNNNLINVDCGTGVPDSVLSTLSAATSSLTRPSTLPSRCGRFTSGQSTDVVTSSQRLSDVGDTRTTYAPRLFFADAGGSRAQGNAAVYRSGSYQNGITRDNENSAINRPSTVTQASYGCGRDQIIRQMSTSGLAPSSDIEVVRGCDARRRRCGCLSSSDGWLCRLFLSTLTSFIAGCLVFFAARYQLRSSLPVAVGVAVSATSALLVALLLSRRCRCIVALLVPAVSTDRGRVGFVLLTVAALLSGPAVNVEFNVREMARSMTCSADVAYNQTLLLLQVTRYLFDILLSMFIVNDYRHCSWSAHEGPLNITETS